MKSLSLNKPHMIVVTGLPGSGKTFFSEKFADTFHAPYASFEKINSFASDAEKAAELYSYLLDELLKTRQSIVIEGKADTRSERTELVRRARTSDYEVLLIWVQTDPLTAKTRATKINKHSPNTIIDPDEYDRRVKRFTNPSALEKPVVISGKHTYASQAKVVLKKLSTPRAEVSAHVIPPIRNEAPGRRNITIR